MGSDLNWFRPLWRRVLVTGIVVAWCLWEWVFTRDTFWGVLTLGLLAYAIWTFFISFPKEDAQDGKPARPQDPPEGR